ncbi:unnamed protein product, partial [Iphiclides podalirius]
MRLRGEGEGEGEASPARPSPATGCASFTLIGREKSKRPPHAPCFMDNRCGTGHARVAHRLPLGALPQAIIRSPAWCAVTVAAGSRVCPSIYRARGAMLSGLGHASASHDLHPPSLHPSMESAKPVVVTEATDGRLGRGRRLDESDGLGARQVHPYSERGARFLPPERRHQTPQIRSRNACSYPAADANERPMDRREETVSPYGASRFSHIRRATIPYSSATPDTECRALFTIVAEQSSGRDLSGAVDGDWATRPSLYDASLRN